MMLPRALQRRRRDRDAELDAVATVVLRLAVLLGAGVTPIAAWSYLGAAGAAVVAASGSGRGIADAIRHSAEVTGKGGTVTRKDPVLAAWTQLATVWDVATEAGAPLAATLRRHARSLRASADVEREIAAALAGPISTARVVLALPVLGILFGAALGFDSLRILFTTPAGAFCLIAGLALVAVAVAWIRSLIGRARAREENPGLRLDLMAIAVSGGGSLDRAAATVERACAASGIPTDSGQRQVDDALDLSRRAGVPAAELLRSQAEESRRRASAEAGRRATVLGVRLMLPLGACILPAFMLLGVAPLLVAVISSTAVGF